MNFKRNQDPAESLNIGKIHVYKEMWLKEMRQYYHELKDWAIEKKIEYKVGKMNFSTGLYELYNIEFEQELIKIIESMFKGLGGIKK